MNREKSNSGIGLDLLANKDKTKKTSDNIWDINEDTIALLDRNYIPYEQQEEIKLKYKLTANEMDGLYIPTSSFSENFLYYKEKGKSHLQIIDFFIL